MLGIVNTAEVRVILSLLSAGLGSVEYEAPVPVVTVEGISLLQPTFSTPELEVNSEEVSYAIKNLLEHPRTQWFFVQNYPNGKLFPYAGYAIA